MAAAAAAAGGENLWQQMLRDCSVRSRLPEANLLVVGDAESGKSALLSRLSAQPAAADAPGDADDAGDSLLAFSTIDVLDPKAKGAGGDASGAWSCEGLERTSS